MDHQKQSDDVIVLMEMISGWVVKWLALVHRSLHKAGKCFGNLDWSQRWSNNIFILQKPRGLTIIERNNFLNKKQSIQASQSHKCLLVVHNLTWFKCRDDKFKQWVCLGRWRHHWSCGRGHAQYHHLWFKKSKESLQLKESGNMCFNLCVGQWFLWQYFV